MKKEVLVSICVVTYNHKDYIKQCLDGILMQQTNFPIEIILGEDESSDGTREICKDYAKKHPDIIKLFLRKREDVIYINGRPTGRFNFMENLKESKGKYIALCEGDDYWTDPLKLQKQVDFLEMNQNYNICFHKVKILYQEEGVIKIDNIAREVIDTTNVNDLANGNFIHTPSVVLRNNFDLPEWFSKSPIGDWTLYMIAIKDRKIKKIEDIMAVYRVHMDSIWSSKSEYDRIIATIKSFKMLLKFKQIHPETKEIIKLKTTYFQNKLPKNYVLLNSWIEKCKWLFNG